MPEESLSCPHEQQYLQQKHHIWLGHAANHHSVQVPGKADPPPYKNFKKQKEKKETCVKQTVAGADQP